MFGCLQQHTKFSCKLIKFSITILCVLHNNGNILISIDCGFEQGLTS